MPRTMSFRAPPCASIGKVGYEDTKRTLKKQEWLRMPVEGAGIVVHDVHRESDR